MNQAFALEAQSKKEIQKALHWFDVGRWCTERAKKYHLRAIREAVEQKVHDDMALEHRATAQRHLKRAMVLQSEADEIKEKVKAKERSR